MRRALSALVVLSFLGAVAFAETLEKAPVNPDTAALYAAERGWSFAVQSREMKDVMSVFTDDVSVLPPDQAIIAGKEAVGAFYKKLLADKAFALNRQPSRVELSGNLAYTLGTYYREHTDKQGKVVSQHGKYVLVWKKQPDETWKVAVDIWNADSQSETPVKK